MCMLLCITSLSFVPIGPTTPIAVLFQKPYVCMRDDLEDAMLEDLDKLVRA